MKRTLILVGALLLVLSGVAAANLLDPTHDGFFDNTPLFQVLNYGPSWHLHTATLDQTTGQVLMIWQQVDGAGQPTGPISVQRWTDTGMSKCVEPVMQLPVPCTPGAILR